MSIEVKYGEMVIYFNEDELENIQRLIQGYHDKIIYRSDFVEMTLTIQAKHETLYDIICASAYVFEGIHVC